MSMAAAKRTRKGKRRPKDAGGTPPPSVFKRSTADVVSAWRDQNLPLPLEVILKAMEEELSDPENIRLGRANRRAFVYAREAAPFFHAKPQSGYQPQDDPEGFGRKIVDTVHQIDASIAGPPAGATSH